MRNLLNLLLVLAALMTMAFKCGPDNETATNNENRPAANAQPSPTEKTKSTPTPAPSATPKSAKVNMESFNELKTGMTYAQAVAVLGKEGEVLSENNIGGARTVMYQWKADEGSWGANMNAMFQNGKLISKSQFGLK